MFYLFAASSACSIASLITTLVGSASWNTSPLAPTTVVAGFAGMLFFAPLALATLFASSPCSLGTHTWVLTPSRVSVRTGPRSFPSHSTSSVCATPPRGPNQHNVQPHPRHRVSERRHTEHYSLLPMQNPPRIERQREPTKRSAHRPIKRRQRKFPPSRALNEIPLIGPRPAHHAASTINQR